MKHMTPLQFIAELHRLQASFEDVVRDGLKEAAEIVEEEAKDRIGSYQSAAGPFKAWDPLEPSTRERRVSEGFTADDPLHRSGELQRSIEHSVGRNEAVIGSNNEAALPNEMGTGHAPPRSFLGGALYSKADEVVEVIGNRVFNHLAGR